MKRYYSLIAILISSLTSFSYLEGAEGVTATSGHRAVEDVIASEKVSAPEKVIAPEKSSQHEEGERVDSHNKTQELPTDQAQSSSTSTSNQYDPFSELTHSQKDFIVQSIDYAISKDLISTEQMAVMMGVFMDLASSIKKEGAREAAFYLLPLTGSHYSKPLIRKLHAMILDLDNPALEELSDLHITFSGFLRGIAENGPIMSDNVKVGEIASNGFVRFNSYFSLGGPDIREVVKQLKFKIKAGNNELGGWDKVLPISTSESRSASVEGFSIGRNGELAVCGVERYDLNCKDWAIFQKHLRGCNASHIEGLCMERARTSPKLKEILKNFWKYETDKMKKSFARVDKEDGKEDERHLTYHMGGYHEAYLITRFKTAEQFADDAKVQDNFLWLLVLEELVRRDLYHSSKELKDPAAQSERIKDLLEDAVAILAKDKMIEDGNSSALGRVLTGESLSRKAELFIKGAIDQKVKVDKKDNAHQRLRTIEKEPRKEVGGAEMGGGD